MKALVNWILKEKLGFVEKACEKPNIHIGFSRELLLEKLFYPSGWIVDSMTFKYRRKITITEQSGSDLTDYQVLIELNSTNFNFEHAQTNGEDIRFTDASGNLLDYWIEEWDAVNESAKVWVKVPSIPANGTVEIWMYYGNDKITDASDPDATFLFYDDFSTRDTNKWQWDATADWEHDADLGLARKIYTASAGDWHDPLSSTALSIPISPGIMVETYAQNLGTWSAYNMELAFIIDGTTYHTDWGVGAYDDIFFLVGEKVNEEWDEADTRQWNLIQHSIKDGEQKIWIAGVLEATETVSPLNTLEGVKIQSKGKSEWDWYRIRRYVEPEPSVSIGVEETA